MDAPLPQTGPYARQQSTVAGLGARALAGLDLGTLMDQTVVAVAEALDVEFSKVLELLPDSETFLLRAGVGWNEGLVGQTTVGAGLLSQAGYTMARKEPVVVEDSDTETRFAVHQILRDHGVVSGISVVVGSVEHPFGVLGAHTAQRRTFTEQDISFVQAVANVLAAAIERWRGEEALRQSQRQLQAQYKGFPLPTYTWQHIDGDFVLIDHNDAAETMTRGRIGELTGRRASDLYGEDDPEILDDMRRCFCAQATVRRQHHYRVRSTGDERELDTAYVFVPPDIVMVHVEDITERLAGEQALRASEERFRLLAEHAQDMIFRVTAEHGFDYVSPAVTAMAGYEPTDYYGDPEFPLKIVHPDDRAKLERMITDRETGPVELRWIAKDGRVIWTEQTNTPIYDESGAAVAFEGIVRDITKRRRAEDEIRLLLTLTQAVEEADDFDGALSTVLTKVSEATGWDYGEAWLPNAERHVLELGRARCARAPEFDEFRRLSSEFVFAPSSGLPGRVWHTKRLEWIEDVWNAEERLVFLRAPFAKDACLRSALAVPILAEGEVVAVLAFFACRVLPEDKRTMDFISGTAAQLGSVVLRKRAEEELRTAREALEEQVQGRLELGVAYGLTFRETTVLHLVAQGKSDKEIAVELSISPLTAQKHMSNILSKMHAASRTEAGVRALREGLLG